MGVKKAFVGANSRNFEAQNGILAANMAFALLRDLFRVQNQVAYSFERKSGRYGCIRGIKIDFFGKFTKIWVKISENSDILAQKRCFFL